jgi:hypothetical protein
VAFGDDGHPKPDSSGLAVQMENRLSTAASVPDDELNLLDVDVALAEPSFRFSRVCLKRPRASDAPAYGVVQFGHVGKRPD